MTQYEVWTLGGGYFNAFKNYSDACELADSIKKKYPDAYVIIKEKEV